MPDQFAAGNAPQSAISQIACIQRKAPRASSLICELWTRATILNGLESPSRGDLICEYMVILRPLEYSVVPIPLAPHKDHRLDARKRVAIR